MMEHSVQRYLERQATEKLLIALQAYSQKAITEADQQYIYMITETLRNRGVDITDVMAVDD